MTLVVVSMAVIMVAIDGSVVAVANPYIGRDLHASLADLQWITNSYLLALAVSLILGGKLGDHFGRRRVFLAAVSGFTAASLAIGLVGSTDGVIVLRAVQGAFGALLLPNTLALLRAAYPAEALYRAGTWVSASAVATAAGPIVGGLFVEHISWQSVFFINLPVGMATVGLGLLVLSESRQGQRRRFDIPGVVTARVAQAITQGSHEAFMAGLHLTMAVAASAALVGAALGPFVRRGSTRRGTAGPVL